MENREVIHIVQGFALGYSHSSAQVSPNEYHYHESYEIMYLRKGSRDVFVRDKKYRFQPGNVVFVDKNTIHKSSAVTEEYERFVLNFTDDYLLPSVAAQAAPLFEQVIFAPDDAGEVDRIFFGIYEEWKRLGRDDALAADLLRSYVNLLLAQFIRHSGAWALDARVSNPAVERLVQYINANFAQPLTLEDAARMLKITPAYLSRIFVKNTGFCFCEYLKLVRIKKAKFLLETTQAPIKQIAFDCGFSDSNYFSYAFKKSVGVSPLQYRKGR